ncbi:hypothetical protein WJX79_010107 [Trebouxia sp. C0005]
MRHSDIGPCRLPNVAQKQNLQSVPLLQQDVFQVDGVLSELEAARFIETAERLGLEHQGSRGAAHGEAHRDNERVAFQDEAFAKHLWQMSGLADVFRQMDLDNQTAIGVNPNIRLYKYGPAAKGKQKGVTKSSPGLLGGDTIFYGHRGKVVATVVPKAGRALLHRHGDACLEHESAPVKAETVAKALAKALATVVATAVDTAVLDAPALPPAEPSRNVDVDQKSLPRTLTSQCQTSRQGKQSFLD